VKQPGFVKLETKPGNLLKQHQALAVSAIFFTGHTGTSIIWKNAGI
jgi:hypothetical protein